MLLLLILLYSRLIWALLSTESFLALTVELEFVLAVWEEDAVADVLHNSGLLVPRSNAPKNRYCNPCPVRFASRLYQSLISSNPGTIPCQLATEPFRAEAMFPKRVDQTTSGSCPISVSFTTRSKCSSNNSCNCGFCVVYIVRDDYGM